MDKQKPKLVQGAPQEAKTSDAKVAQPNQAALPRAGSQGVTQREAVYNEVMRIIREEKISVGEKRPLKALLNESQIKNICAALVAGFKAKKIALKETESNKKKLSDDRVMELYCLGLLNNWLRRDKRLNGVGEAK